MGVIEGGDRDEAGYEGAMQCERTNEKWYEQYQGVRSFVVMPSQHSLTIWSAKRQGLVAHRARVAANPILAAKIRSMWGTIVGSLSLPPSVIFSGDGDGDSVLVVIAVTVVVVACVLSLNTKHCRGGKLPIPLLVFPNVRETSATTVPPLLDPPQMHTSSKRDRSCMLFSVADCEGLNR